MAEKGHSLKVDFIWQAFGTTVAAVLCVAMWGCGRDAVSPVDRNATGTDALLFGPEEPDARRAANLLAVEIQRRLGNKPLNLKVRLDSTGKPLACDQDISSDPPSAQLMTEAETADLCRLVLRWDFKAPEGQTNVTVHFGSSLLR